MIACKNNVSAQKAMRNALLCDAVSRVLMKKKKEYFSVVYDLVHQF
jgi:hypothetical protein